MSNKVSIIMPAYNASAYIAEAIQSVLNQTWTNWELIIVDDGSTDDTLQIAQSFARKDSRIQVYHQHNQGGCAARNEALKHITGNYVQYLDADDVLHADKLSLQMAIYNQPDETDGLLVFSKCYRLHSTGELSPASMSWLYHDYMNPVDLLIATWNARGNAIQYSSYLIPKNIVDKVGLWNINLTRSQDCEYMARVLSNALHLCYVDTAVYYYRIVTGSVSNKPLSLRQIESECDVADVVSSIILARVKTKEAIRACSVHYTDLLTAYYPKNKLFINRILSQMKIYNLPFNFENRGRLFHMLKNIFGWRVAVRIINLKNIIRL